MSFYKRPYFWAGIAVRLLCAPLLLQWFHPDERQMLEFAHFQAHGRLHPFLESQLHLRNQSFPWLESWIVRACDSLGLHSPWAYLTTTHAMIGIFSWISLCLLIESERLGWFFALFWAFPFLYSRQLSETISLIPTLLLFASIKKKRFGAAGFCAGATAILRYPSALWGMGGLLLFLSRPDDRRKPKAWILGAAGFALAILLGGLADLHLYGKFLESAPAYWAFNQPNGPVEKIFGKDGLDTYFHWFAFIFTPWLAPLFILLALVALSTSNSLFLFTFPYLAGHLWTSHREPRFMIPLTPFLILAIADYLSPRARDYINDWKKHSPRLTQLAFALVWIHVALNFAWYPFNAWAQWRSAQGVLTRHYNDLASEPTRFITLADPVIDALVPPNARWADASCQWHRPALTDESHARVWILSDSPRPGCTPAVAEALPEMKSTALQRLLRVRVASLWRCSFSTLEKICPAGFREPPAGEPTFKQP